MKKSVKQAAAPVQRRSVVRKSPRGPSVRPAKKPVRTAAPTPSSAISSPQPLASPASLAALSEISSAEERFSIPSGYGDTRIVLMARDPWWLYAYWEICSSDERAARMQLLPKEIAGLQTVLRVYDVSGRAKPEQLAFDIPLSGLANSWYVKTDAPAHEFLVDIGLLTAAGKFLRLARSNRAATPRFGPSNIVDERWSTSDDVFWKLFGATGTVGGSSPGEWMALRIGLPGQGLLPVVRGFWSRVNTDLVIHGTTAPKSSISILGRPVEVRTDGTFSLRVSLPEGTRAIIIDVTSPDGAQTKTVTPIISLAWSGPLAPTPADAPALKADAAESPV